MRARTAQNTGVELGSLSRSLFKLRLRILTAFAGRLTFNFLTDQLYDHHH